MTVVTRNTTAHHLTIQNLGDLHDAMEEEDNEFGPDIKVESVKSGSRFHRERAGGR